MILSHSNNLKHNIIKKDFLCNCNLLEQSLQLIASFLGRVSCCI